MMRRRSRVVVIGGILYLLSPFSSSIWEAVSSLFGVLLAADP